MRQTFDKEKVSLNLARIKTHGENFEIVIDPDNAVKFRHGEVNIRDALKTENIFKDATKGDLAKEQHMQKIFNTTDPLKIAERIIREGSIQVSDEYREKLRSQKLKTITGILMKNGADAKTGEPLSAVRINNALRDANVNLDIFKEAEEQIDDVVSKLRPALSITFEKKILDLRIPANNAAKLYGYVSTKADILDEAWLSDGSWSCKAEISAGMVTEFLDEVKSKTHGDIEVSVENKPRENKKTK